MLGSTNKYSFESYDSFTQKFTTSYYHGWFELSEYNLNIVFAVKNTINQIDEERATLITYNIIEKSWSYHDIPAVYGYSNFSCVKVLESED